MENFFKLLSLNQHFFFTFFLRVCIPSSNFFLSRFKHLSNIQLPSCKWEYFYTNFLWVSAAKEKNSITLNTMRLVKVIISKVLNLSKTEQKRSLSIDKTTPFRSLDRMLYFFLFI